MDPIALAAGTALVSAMAADAWQETHTAVVAWWRKVHPERVDAVRAELESVRTQVRAARGRADEDAEQNLAEAWSLRFQDLLDDRPALGPELHRLVAEYLAPLLPSGERTGVQQITVSARARDRARQYIAGRDQTISEL